MVQGLEFTEVEHDPPVRSQRIKVQFKLNSEEILDYFLLLFAFYVHIPFNENIWHVFKQA